MNPFRGQKEGARNCLKVTADASIVSSADSLEIVYVNHDLHPSCDKDWESSASFLSPPQSPGRSWISGKNSSVHTFGGSLIEPTAPMNTAVLNTFSGVSV